MLIQFKKFAVYYTTPCASSGISIIVTSCIRMYFSTGVSLRTYISPQLDEMPETSSEAAYRQPSLNITVKQEISENTATTTDQMDQGAQYYICGFTGRLVRREQWYDYLNSNGTMPAQNICNNNSDYCFIEGKRNDKTGVAFALRRLVFSRLSGEQRLPRPASKNSTVSPCERGFMDPCDTTDCSPDTNLVNVAYDDESSNSSSSNINNNININSNSINSCTLPTNLAKDIAINLRGRGDAKYTNHQEPTRPLSEGKEKSAIRIVLEGEDTKPLPPIPYKGLWGHVSRNVKLIDEFNFSKRSRRLSRINIAAKFLRDHHVILHSVLRWAPVYSHGMHQSPSVSYCNEEITRGNRTLKSSSSDYLNSSLRRKKDTMMTEVTEKNEAVDSSRGENSTDVKSNSTTSTNIGPPRRNIYIEGTWNVSSPFYRVAMIGETFVKSEISLRIAKLFPKMSVITETNENNDRNLSSLFFCSTLLPELTNSCVSQECLATLFDECDFGRLVEKEGRRWRPLKSEEKANMMLAIIGELHWFAARTKATDRTHVNAMFPPSDVLIMHVLSTHVTEALLSELLFSHLRPIADLARRHSWPLYPSEMVEQVADVSPRTPSSYTLATISRPFDPEVDVLRNLLPGLTPPAEGRCGDNIVGDNGDNGDNGLNDKNRIEEEHSRRYRLLVANEKKQFLAREEMKKKEIEKAKERLERKVKKHASLMEASLSLSPNTTEEKEKINDNLIILSQAIEWKKKCIMQWEVCQEARTSNVTKMLDNKLLHILSSLEYSSTKNNKEDISLSSKGIRTSSSSSSCVVAPFPLVKPLLHKHPFGPGSTVRVCQSDVVLNYKRYRQLCLDNNELEIYSNKRMHDVSFSLTSRNKEPVNGNNDVVINTPSLATYFEMIKM